MTYKFWKEECKNYHIDPVWGVLFPNSPEQKPSQNNDVWYQVAENLPDIINAGNVREQIKDLLEKTPFEINNNLFDTDREITFDPKLYAAMRDVSFVAQAYIWGDDPSKQPPDNILPEFIAKPYEELANLLGTKPAMQYPLVILINAKTPKDWNYEKVDEIKPEIFDIERRFTNPRIDDNGKEWDDEKWFYQVHMAVEATSSFALKAMRRSFEIVFNPNFDEIDRANKLKEQFDNISKGADNMMRCMNEMYTGCDKSFFGKAPFRLYLQGSKEVKQGEVEGVIFEGAKNPNPQSFIGASGAQTPSIAMLSSFFSVGHADVINKFLAANKAFYTKDHQTIIDAIQRDAHVVKEFAQEQNIWKDFAKSVRSLGKFRSGHSEQVDQYLPGKDGGLGGGKKHLKTIRDDTNRAAHKPSTKPDSINPIEINPKEREK